MSDVAEARMELDDLIKRLRDSGISPEDRLLFLVWISRQRKVIEEIEAVLQVKTPTMDDELREITEFPEFSPKRWYIVTQVEDPHYVALAGHPMPFHFDGRQVTERLTREDENGFPTIAHVYEVNDDGTLTLKR